MPNLDLNYICKSMGDLSGMPIRVYKEGQLVFYHSIVSLPKDPICIYQTEILSVKEHVGYFVTPLFYYYGIINSNDEKIVIGPTRQIPNTEQELKEIAFQADVPSYDVDNFVIAMKSIIPMPFDSVMQMLCVLNHVLNGENIELRDISIIDTQQEALITNIETERTENDYVFNEERSHDLHNTYPLEQEIQRVVLKGDVKGFQEWAKNAPAVRGGTVAQDQIRQLRNIFIVTITLVSRAAIRGGLDVDEALTLSDSYIQKCELTSSIGAIINLQYRMILDYTERVNHIRCGKNPSKLMLDVANFVQHNLSNQITTELIAKELFLSRTYLSAKFKADSGETLYKYIQNEKITEAKRLLRYTDKTIIAISTFLGFSSQSHFNRVFKAFTNLTPNEYREKHLKF